MSTRRLITASLLSLTLLAPVALAQTSGPAVPNPQTTAQQPCTPGNGIDCPAAFDPNINGTFVTNLINTVANWLFTFLLVLAVVFIVLAAYKYLFSQGSGEAVEAAHKMLLYAAVAVAVALLSRGFVYVIRNVTTGALNGASTSQQPAGGGGTGSTGGGSSDPAFAPVSSFTAFAVRVELCRDGLIPGVVIIDDDGQRWGNFSLANVPENDLGGNPEIGSQVAGATQNAGQFTQVGVVNTAALGLGFLGLGTDYQFQVEICNNGGLPEIIYNRGTNSDGWIPL